MRFAFTQDQLDFADAVRDLLGNECGPAQLRLAWENESGRIPGLWDRLVEMGVVGLLAPEGVGGLGLAEIDLVRIAYEAGRVALPEPLSVVAGVVVPALRDHAATADAERFLSDICAGASTVALGLAVNPLIVGGSHAAMFVLEADDGLHLVDPDVVDLAPETSVDGSRRVARASWTPSPATLMCGNGGATEALARAATFTAAELCGLADTMLALTTGYVTERKQFGVPIGSFQAIKHHCANALLKVEFAKPLVWRAAYSLARGDADAGLHASMAKAAASDAADVVGRIAMQCHGGIGYTVEYDLHLYLKRAWALVAQDGSAASHRRRVADIVLA